MTTRPAIFVLALLAAASRAFAQDQPPAFALSYGGQPEAATPIYAYAGGPITFTLAAQAPLGTHLRIYADLAQVTGGSLAAPLLRNVAVSPELVFDRRTSMLVPCTLPVLAPVRTRTRMSLALRTGPGDPDVGGRLSVTLFVYPLEDRGAWKKILVDGLAESGLRRLAVFGGSQSPRAFLRERNVPFDDLGADWPAGPDTHTLYLAEIVGPRNTSVPLPVPRQFGELPGVRLMLFGPDIAGSLPPGVYQTADFSGGSVWKVTLPALFEDLGTHPQNLELLDEIFSQALNSHTAAPAGENRSN